jgi:hypothetical protein
METNKMNQGFHHFFAAKYCNFDPRAGQAFGYFMTMLVKSGKQKEFIADISKNMKLIVEDLKEVDYVARRPKEITLEPMNVITQYDGYSNWQHDKVLSMAKVLSTAVEIKPEITVNIINSNIQIVDNENVIDIERAEAIVEQYGYTKGYTIKVEKEIPKIIVAEAAKISYEEVKDLSLVSVEDIISGSDYYQFVVNCGSGKKFLSNKTYMERLRGCLTSKDAAIPVIIETQKGDASMSLTLPKILRNFMNPHKILHSQDIAKAMIKEEGLVIEEVSGPIALQQFMTAIKESPAKVLFNASWLDDDVYEFVKTYIPYFTGCKGRNFILMTAKDYMVGSLKLYKLLLNSIQKVAKIYGLCLRAGMAGANIRLYINRLVGTKDTAFANAIRANLVFWSKDLYNVELNETAAFTVDDTASQFDTGEIDMEAIDGLFNDLNPPHPRIVMRDDNVHGPIIQSNQKFKYDGPDYFATNENVQQVQYIQDDRDNEMDQLI